MTLLRLEESFDIREESPSESHCCAPVALKMGRIGQRSTRHDGHG